MQIEQGKKNQIFTNNSDRRVWVFFILSVFVNVILVPVVLTEFGYSPTQIFFAGILLSFCIYPAFAYWARQDADIPAFPLLCLAYALQFAFPVITRDATIVLAGGYIASLSNEDVIACLLLSILGVLALGAGYYGFQLTRPQSYLPVVALPIDVKKAVMFSVVMGLLIPMLSGTELFLSGESATQFSAIARVLSNQVLVSIALMSAIIFNGNSVRWHWLLLLAITTLATLRGMSTSFLEHGLMPLAVLLMMRWQYTKKLPLVMVGVSLLLVVFLSPVKQDYRMALSTTTESEGAGSVFEKTFLWVSTASEYWSDAITGGQSFKETSASASSRLDLIHQFAHIYSMTPSVVPYQNGATYSYFAIALVPRFLWPDKPEAGGANYFYAVNYNITTEEGAKRSSFGMSLLAESFINFGWLGVVLMMAIQGAFLCALHYVLGSASSGIGGQSVFVAFFVYFLNGIGSSAEIMFGNIVQSLLLSVILLYWVKAAPAKSSVTHVQNMQTYQTVRSR